MLMLAHNLPQTAPDAIANDCAVESPARNKAHAGRARILHCESREHDELAPFGVAGLFYAIKI